MHVQVLLSTFNGEKYIAEQIQSILNQSYENLSILIRDDGSEDNTLEIVQQYCLRYPSHLKLLKGKNIGVIKSFQMLLVEADNNALYYSFCDQDDVWLPHKVEAAVKVLNSQDEIKPLMHFSSTYLTDSSLKTTKIWPDSPSKNLTFYNALVENIAVGTTITINKSAKEMLVRKQPNSNNLIMHDWWFYLCVSAFGQITYDSLPSVLYRQHEANLVGGNTSLKVLILRKIRSFSTNKGKRLLYKQALEFWKCYGDEINSEQKDQLQLFLKPRNNIIRRISFLRHSKLYRQSFQENLLYKCLILIGYI